MPECRVPSFPVNHLKFIQGDGFTSLDTLKGKHVVVLENWAEYCGPCKTIIPHLTSLQQQYGKKGLLVVGITSDKEEKKVKSFVSKMGDKMKYCVAMDSQSEMNKYFSHFGMNGIPYAILIDHMGIIRWQGHPAEGEFQNKIDVLCNEFAIWKTKNVLNVSDKTSNGIKSDGEETFPIGSLDFDHLSPLSISLIKNIFSSNGISFDNEIEKKDFIAKILKVNGEREIKAKGITVKKNINISENQNNLEEKEEKKEKSIDPNQSIPLDANTVKELKEIDLSSLSSLSIKELNILIKKFSVSIPSSGMEKSDLVNAIKEKQREICK